MPSELQALRLPRALTQFPVRRAVKKLDSDPVSNAIPVNCTESALPVPVRDFAELLAEIAARKIRAKQPKKEAWVVEK